MGATKFLNVVLCISWLTGLFPTQNPLTIKSRQFHFGWLKPITIIAGLILLFDVSLMVDFGINNVIFSSHNSPKTARDVAALLVEGSCVVYLIVGDGILRFIAIFSCRKLCELIHAIDALEALRRNSARKYCPYIYNSYCAIIFASFMNLLHQSLRVNNLVNIFKPVSQFVHMTIIPNNDWVIRIAFWVENFFMVFAFAFGLSITILLGTNLMSLYLGYCYEVKACWGMTVVCYKGYQAPDFLQEDREGFLDKFVEKFKELKKAFALYNTVVGPIAFVMLFSSVMAFVHAVYSLSTTHALMNIPGTIGSLFWVGFLAYFGNFMENKIRDNREELRNIVISQPKHAHPSVCAVHLKQVTEWIITWKWKLTAGNLFSINNTLLPAALGTSMTYVIFIFQLRMTDGRDNVFSNITVHG